MLYEYVESNGVSSSRETPPKLGKIKREKKNENKLAKSPGEKFYIELIIWIQFLIDFPQFFKSFLRNRDRNPTNHPKQKNVFVFLKIFLENQWLPLNPLKFENFIHISKRNFQFLERFSSAS